MTPTTTTTTMTRLSHLKAIVNHIEANAPEVATREVYRNRFEGEEEFSVTYNNMEFDCIRRMGLLDTSNLDYYNGTGYSCDVIYDEIAVIAAYNPETGEENEALVDELNEILC